MQIKISNHVKMTKNAEQTVLPDIFVEATGIFYKSLIFFKEMFSLKIKYMICNNPKCTS